MSNTMKMVSHYGIRAYVKFSIVCGGSDHLERKEFWCMEDLAEIMALHKARKFRELFGEDFFMQYDYDEVLMEGIEFEVKDTEAGVQAHMIFDESYSLTTVYTKPNESIMSLQAKISRAREALA